MLTYIKSVVKCVSLRPIISKGRFESSCLVRNASNSVEKPEGFVYEPDFTDDQQKYILQRLNEADAMQLARFSLPKNRIKKIDDWRKKNGKFNKLVDVLDVDGLGVKILDKLCKNILQGENGTEASCGKEKPVKTRGQILTPAMSHYQCKELTSALGIHIYATGLSWAKIEREHNSLTDWNTFDFNLGTKKLSPADALQLVIDVSHEIPTSDVYIFEAPISVTPTAQQSQISVSAYVQKVQLLSMLITLLSTSPKHNLAFIKMQETKASETPPTDLKMSLMDPKVFFLRYKLPARLFRTLIGTERVSAATTVSNILLNIAPEKYMYTPLNVNDELQEMYNKQLPVTKEVLGQALLLTMAFMDVCVYHNTHSLKIISSNNR